MDQYNREGLNYVPLLTQNNSPPCSSRSRLSLNKNKSEISQRSLIYYNGNYEGDNSMFQSLELERLSLVDTESDTEFQNYITTSRSTLKEETTNICFIKGILHPLILSEFFIAYVTFGYIGIISSKLAQPF
ncbi:uncharacterized protein ACRADG_002656 isoform 3-T3 [Cochliomyia hominivorax]